MRTRLLTLCSKIKSASVATMLISIVDSFYRRSLFVSRMDRCSRSFESAYDEFRIFVSMIATTIEPKLVARYLFQPKKMVLSFFSAPREMNMGKCKRS